MSKCEVTVYTCSVCGIYAVPIEVNEPPKSWLCNINSEFQGALQYNICVHYILSILNKLPKEKLQTFIKTN